MKTIRAIQITNGKIGVFNPKTEQQEVVVFVNGEAQVSPEVADELLKVKGYILVDKPADEKGKAPEEPASDKEPEEPAPQDSEKKETKEDKPADEKGKGKDKPKHK